MAVFNLETSDWVLVSLRRSLFCSFTIFRFIRTSFMSFSHSPCLSTNSICVLICASSRPSFLLRAVLTMASSAFVSASSDF
ncbi:hypothetical protein Mapa_016400 [Marchantia paleacea]|nr:hypothetical protein Mapa_016400 [Marchantia paleacea]